MFILNTDITKISRVGAATTKKLKKLGIETAEDLLFYFPFRYDDFSKISKINELKSGQAANIVGQIELIQNKRSFRKRMYITEALVSDESDTIKIIWFNQPFIAKNLRVGDYVSLAGKVEDDYGGLAMISPVYEKMSTDLHRFNTDLNRYTDFRKITIHTQGLVPNYHLTANITHKQVRFLIKQIIGLADKVIDWLPVEIKRNLKLLNLNEAIKKIHFPKNWNDVNQAKKRLAFNELFLLQLQAQLFRREYENRVSAPIKFFEVETKKFVDSLPFKLTNAQRKAAWEILRDMEKAHPVKSARKISGGIPQYAGLFNRVKPMARLLEGDVGSGKTVVAAIAMLNTALNGKQAVLMAPTEILARQHYESICKLFADFDIKVGLITSSDKRLSYDLGFENYEFKKNKAKSILNSLFIIHNSQIIIGTHALIQEDVEFKDLALAVIDEQHRFGVEQRKTLIENSGNKKIVPHLLSMTATPIPRSLALALYGDLDISIINEMPVGRKNVFTKVVAEENREKAYQFIREQIKIGKQVFVICPLIDVSDKLGVKSVKAEFEKLDKNVFPEIKMGMLHGRMKSKEKEKVMNDFLNNKIKILVSTSVVEVGVDVPNASIMMIEGADRFGLAQLHQFRGRVGRSEYQSYCFLFFESNNEKTLKRLDALVNCFDGFQLAKMDLKFRGPGEVYGTLQKGFPELKIASLFDYELMKLAKEEAEKIIKKDANLSSWPALKRKIEEMEMTAHLE